jgi:deoxyribose-phosphate aldolase
MNKYEEALARCQLSMREEDVRRLADRARTRASDNNKVEVLRKIYGCLDLTSLGSGDCWETLRPWVETVNEAAQAEDGFPQVAALCVYPRLVAAVRQGLKADVRLASVAGGFPSAQTFTEIKVAEVSLALAAGADEVDVVLNCGALLEGSRAEVVEELMEMKAACRGAKMKVILETGLLGDVEVINEAAVLALYSGADFLKTSTGKDYPGATPEAVVVLCRALRDYALHYGRRAGVKVSGGVRSVRDALVYYTLVQQQLGDDWMQRDNFRIGASRLANELMQEIVEREKDARRA